MSAARWLLALLVLTVWLGSAPLAPAAVTPKVNDEGKFFSPEAVEKANQKIREIYKDLNKELLIETVPAVPADMQARLKDMQAKSKDGKNQFFSDWVNKRAKDAVVKEGICILLCKDPPHLQIEVDKATRARGFTLQDRDALLKKMVGLLREKKNDEALAAAVEDVQSTLRANLRRPVAATSPAKTGATPVSPFAPPTTPVAANRPVEPAKPVEVAGLSVLNWVCIGAAVLIGLWVLMGIFRGLGRAGGAAPGYGGGGGGGGYGGGGGGGGFMTGLLGGMFGAAAGSWLYDTFARGGGHSSWGASQALGGPTQGPAVGPTEAGAGDFSGDTGGGASFGDDAGGGGDFGSTDASGGGDFGGGGGDFGGGGGDFGGGDF